MMSELARLSVSLERTLFNKLDDLVDGAGYGNRSAYVRDLIRAKLVEREWSGDDEAVGTVTLLFDRTATRLGEQLQQLISRHQARILASTQVHLDQELCAQMIMLRGRANELRHVAEELSGPAGVLHAALSMSSTGASLS